MPRLRLRDRFPTRPTSSAVAAPADVEPVAEALAEADALLAEAKKPKRKKAKAKDLDGE